MACADGTLPGLAGATKPHSFVTRFATTQALHAAAFLLTPACYGPLRAGLPMASRVALNAVRYNALSACKGEASHASPY